MVHRCCFAVGLAGLLGLVGLVGLAGYRWYQDRAHRTVAAGSRTPRLVAASLWAPLPKRRS
jgi:hypothetical protein